MPVIKVTDLRKTFRSKQKDWGLREAWAPFHLVAWVDTLFAATDYNHMGACSRGARGQRAL
jgi:hypothetical protein